MVNSRTSSVIFSNIVYIYVCVHIYILTLYHIYIYISAVNLAGKAWHTAKVWPLALGPGQTGWSHQTHPEWTRVVIAGEWMFFFSLNDVMW